MKHGNFSITKKGAQLALGTALWAFAQTATAANVTVRVVDSESLQPVSGVAVCMGSQHYPGAFGAMRTNDAGEVVYASSPASNYILSVAGNGRGDYVRELAPRSFDIIHYVELKDGTVGSRCLAPAFGSEGKLGKDALDLVSVDVRSHSHHAGTVDIATSTKGVQPTHIRVSTQPNFAGARWMPYRSVTRHAIERVSSKDLYVQVKRTVSQEGGSVEALSTAQIGDLHWD